MTAETPRVHAYLERFEAALRRHKLKEWSEISRDLRSHIGKAVDYGKPIEDVLASFGPPEALARSYAVELLMETPGGSGGISRFLRLVGLLATGGLATFVVVVALESIGFTFLLSGVAFIAIGAIEAMGVHLPNVQLAGLPPLLVVAMGPAFLAVGWAAFWGLSKYAKFIVGVWRRTAPAHG